MFAPTEDDDANRLVDSDPFALVIGMLLDQQISIAWAFQGPLRLKERLGASFSACGLAQLDEQAVIDAFCEKPAVHRYPAVMARRASELSRYLCETYGDDVAAVWKDASDGAELFARVQALPGFGEEKAMIFVAVLAKRFGIAPPGWHAAAGPFADDSPRSAADADGAEGRAAIKAWKKRQRELGRTKQQ